MTFHLKGMREGQGGEWNRKYCGHQGNDFQV